MTQSKAQQLRKHKLLATGLFLLMVLVYIVMIYCLNTFPANWMGYVKAFSEAAMVGALADWFAVTALFHHPLGIPIPHTNLIEKSKQSIGDNLGDFVVGNFLTPQNIRPYILRLSVTTIMADWLDKGKNKQLLLVELRKLLQDILSKLDDDRVAGFIAHKGGELVEELKLHHMVAQALTYFMEKKEQEPLITLLADKVRSYIEENQQMVQDKVHAESFFLIPKFVDKKLAEKISHGLMRYFDDIAHDPDHKIRSEIDRYLRQFINDLYQLPKWANELDKLKAGLLTTAHKQKYATDIWKMLKQTMTVELEQDDSGLNRYFDRTIQELTNSLRSDELLQQRIDSWIRHTAYKYILRNTDNVGQLISNTVGNWKGRELSSKLELEVGKDLQFIRINGTLVGGLVGLLIYALTRFLA